MRTYKSYPEDTIGNGFLAIKLPMNNDGKTSGGMFNMSTTTEEQAVSNYINLLMTRKGERYMQPEFGIGIQLFLFEPNTEIIRTEIESEIHRQCSFWLPYIINHKIDVRDRANVPGLNSTDAENGIQIVITFSVTESGANRVITLFGLNGQININII